MKAFLLAAGHGSRLRPITDNLPKCLVPIRGVPLLEIWLDICRRAGITDVLLNVHAHAGMVHAAVQKYQGPVRVRISEEPVLLGSAGTLLANRDWIELQNEFWILYGDVLTTADLAAMLRFHRKRQPVATLGVYEVAEPRRCGIVNVNSEGMIQEFVEKPENPVSNVAFSGLMIGSGRLLDYIPAKFPADLAFDVLGHIQGAMLAYHLGCYLIDVGTMETYKTAQATWPGLD